MYLFEHEKTGIFISTNSQKGVQGLQEIFLHFLKEYLPQYQSNRISSSPINVELKKFEGNYVPTRTSLSGIGRIQSLFSTRLSFQESKNGMPFLLSGNQRIELVPTGSNAFVDTTKFVHKTISFNSGGERTIMNYSIDKGIYGIWPFMRLKWYEEQHLQYPFRILCALLFLSIPIYWTVRYLRKKNDKEDFHEPNNAFNCNALRCYRVQGVHFVFHGLRTDANDVHGIAAMANQCLRFTQHCMPTFYNPCVAVSVF